MKKLHVNKSQKESQLLEMYQALANVEPGNTDFTQNVRELLAKIEDLEYKLHRERLLEKQVLKEVFMEDRSLEFRHLLITKYDQLPEDLEGLSLIELRDLVDKFELEDRTVIEFRMTRAGHTSKVVHKKAA